MKKLNQLRLSFFITFLMLWTKIMMGHFQEPPGMKHQDLIERLRSTVLLHDKEDQKGDMKEYVTAIARCIQY